jgi:hypothetical protein
MGATSKGYWVFGVLFCALLAGRAGAANAVFIPGAAGGSTLSGGSLEVQGASGRIDIPITFAMANLGQSLNVSGATATDSTVYTLLNSTIPSINSVLQLSDPHTGNSLGTIQLDAQLSDIAYSNGQLYGVGSSSTSLQIDTIAANGATHNVLSQAMSSSTATWRLSGVANGSGLLAARGSFSSSNVPGFVIDPSSFSVSQITLSGTANSQLNDTVINAAGNTVTSIASQQTNTSFPGGTSLGNVASNARYGTSSSGNAVSDEFNYNYSPTLPAVIQTIWNPTVSPLVGGADGLTRTAQVVSVSGPITISNFVKPDGTTLSNVVATNQITQFKGAPLFGSTPFNVSIQNNAPGDLSTRIVGQATATLNLGIAQRGVYSIQSTPSIAADYSYGTTVDQGRAVQARNVGGASFAYDPASSNLVGNGDAALSGAGWQGKSGSLFVSQIVNADSSDHSFEFSPFSNFPAGMRQFLQEPTPNSPMQLSFTYNLLFSTSANDDIQIFLNTVLVADVVPTSTSALTFQTQINDPTLENLSNAVLLIQATTSGNSGVIEVGNISLTAVPEPVGALILVVVGAVICARRSRKF